MHNYKNTTGQIHKRTFLHSMRNTIQPILAMTQTMHHTVTTSHLIMQQHLKDRTIVKEKWEENSGQKISINKIPINRSSDNKEDSWNTVIRTRYRRVIRKVDRLAY